jgi:hypothetical protein
MSKTTMLLATALTALAFAALPALASAGTPETHCPEGAASCTIQIVGGAANLTRTANSLKVECSTMTGTGTMGTTGGSITLTFHGCTDSLIKGPCGTSSSGTGTILTTILPYDNIYTTDNKTSPGLLLTPSAGTSHITTVKCLDGHHTLTGNGFIGSINAPACGNSAGSLTVGFTQSSPGHQTHKQVTGTGTVFDLEEGGSTAALVASFTVKAANGGSISLTCV